MNSNEILKKHKIWLTSNGKNGFQIELAADLSYSQIVGADLRCASLNNSNLTHAKLSYTNLRGAELGFCNLEWAELCYTNLECANLSFSNLKNADLRYADLSDTDLRGVNLRDVDLSCPNLNRTILPESTFIIYGEKYIISIYGDYIRASCCTNTHHQKYLASKWRQFSKQDIIDMDGEDSLKFYPRLLDIIDFYCGKGERPEWLKAQNNDL